MSIAVVFPMYNESFYVEKSVENAIRVVGEITSDYEIIIVDDFSADDSGRIADEIARKNPRVKVIHHQSNRKLGGTLKSGFSLAAKEYIFYSDIDMPFDFSEFKKAWSMLLLYKADIVCAYRLNRGADGFKRHIYSVVYNSFVRSLFGLKIRDVNFSFKIIRNSFLKQNELTSEGSFINAELLIKAKRCNLNIVQFPAIYSPRKEGISRLSSIEVILKILQEALCFRFGLLR